MILVIYLFWTLFLVPLILTAIWNWQFTRLGLPEIDFWLTFWAIIFIGVIKGKLTFGKDKNKDKDKKKK